ncbi:MAG TPA: tRNA(Ile)(2)-agmatinylcytidine synthase [Candidatus Thermoplasmatota archaeon]|nr:tRNA(Ile)(2)-agmatinylcytidine synthase [Candidatus Thermoplasmatota archaeon]
MVATTHPMLLAFDDTDGPDGGCTTHLAFQVLLALPGLALSGLPRLVRLNPNVPWKTRGNGAVVLPLARPEGPSARVGELRGREVHAFPDGPRPAPSQAAGILDRVWEVLEAEAQQDAEPGVALFAQPPPAAAYWQAVRTRVHADDAATALGSLGAPHRAAESRRALAGCLGAAAWPGPPASFEFIAYRHPSKWGTERAVHEEPLRSLDPTGATFHTFDAESGRLACLPHTPDPVLLGLRGRDPEALVAAATRTLPFVVQEPIDGWLLWATNHASGDHVSPVASLAEAPGWASVQVAATVAGLPESRRGGHVFVPLRDAAGASFEAAAFEPTHGFREAVRALRPGDGVEVVGSLNEGVVNLEKLHVRSLATWGRRENPKCPACGGSMPSLGKDAGHRCRKCGAKAPPGAGGLVPEERTVTPGWHEVPVMARRHLHRPLGWG